MCGYARSSLRQLIIHWPSTLSRQSLRGDEIFVTAQNLIEFCSVATRPTDANGLGWPVDAVRLEIDRLLGQFPLLDETPQIFVRWLGLVTTHRVIGRRVHDARLVAVMLAHRISHLLTFNSDDFHQFPEIVVIDPADTVSAGST
jgi:predicted nucleic acid-binding protein